MSLIKMMDIVGVPGELNGLAAPTVEARAVAVPAAGGCRGRRGRERSQCPLDLEATTTTYCVEFVSFQFADFAAGRVRRKSPPAGCATLERWCGGSSGTPHY